MDKLHKLSLAPAWTTRPAGFCTPPSLEGHDRIKDIPIFTSIQWHQCCQQPNLNIYSVDSKTNEAAFPTGLCICIFTNANSLHCITALNVSPVLFLQFLLLFPYLPSSSPLLIRHKQWFTGQMDTGHCGVPALEFPFMEGTCFAFLFRTML